MAYNSKQPRDNRGQWSSGGGGGGGVALEEKYEKGMQLTSVGKLVSMIDQNSEGRLNLREIRRVLSDDSTHYVQKQVKVSDLKGAADEGVDPKRATPTKGAIVVTANGFIVDGRHRAALARAKGQTTINAFVPVARPNRKANARDARVTKIKEKNPKRKV